MDHAISTDFIGRRKTSLLARMWRAYERGRTRGRLRELPDYLLEDIGLSRKEADKEARRPAWDVPAWWRG